MTSQHRYIHDEIIELQYDMGEKIGRGSFGIVYKAMKKQTKEVVAIKVLDLDDVEVGILLLFC